MRLDRFTAKFQEALADAQSLAVGHDNQFIEPVHIIVRLLSQDDGAVRPLITLPDQNLAQMSISIRQSKSYLGQGASGDLQISPRTRTTIVCDHLAHSTVINSFP